MGLAASQARLLTITSRKSRAQFENMRLSHQKLALSRSLTDISNEYQNSLNQTKLFYDFYGVNSTDTPLTYDLLMSPSSINDYTPTLMTNNQNQVILSTPYADAARAAGIPMEGLGCQPSSVMRDAFMQALAQNGIITQNTADMICSVDYNQGAGLGNSNLVSTVTTTGDYDALMAMLNDDSAGARLSDVAFTGTQSLLCVEGDSHTLITGPGFTTAQQHSTLNKLDQVSFKDLLSGKEHYYLASQDGHGGDLSLKNMVTDIKAVLSKLGDNLASKVVGGDEARKYADMMMEKECWALHVSRGNGAHLSQEHDKWKSTATIVSDAVGASAFIGGAITVMAAGGPVGWIVGGAGLAVFALGNLLFGKVKNKEVAEASLAGSDNFLLISEAYGNSKGLFCSDPDDHQSVDLSAYAQAWFTYFMQYMYGLGTAEANDLDVYWEGLKSAQKFVNKENCEYQFTFTKEFVSENDALISNFYDTLFNQICVNGWAPNSQIDKDSNYLKEMLQSGMMYVTSMSDDNYFYQNNYATNSFIKEVADDAAIAEAESKYTTQKARINAKEQELDLKMKNLDTEISSLETEYEAVKKVIENNASKSFTRYDG